MRRLEEKKIPETTDFTSIRQLSNEAKTKLSRFRPRSIRQASRIAGVTPADIQILLVHLAG
jgi:tRNA uridine 5-carboxymethylaminomethyl modification enzyme